MLARRLEQWGYLSSPGGARGKRVAGGHCMAAVCASDHGKSTRQGVTLLSAVWTPMQFEQRSALGCCAWQHCVGGWCACIAAVLLARGCSCKELQLRRVLVKRSLDRGWAGSRLAGGSRADRPRLPLHTLCIRHRSGGTCPGPWRCPAYRRNEGGERTGGGGSIRQLCSAAQPAVGVGSSNASQRCTNWGRAGSVAPC